MKSTCHICHNAVGPNPNPQQILEGAIPPLSTLTTRTSMPEYFETPAEFDEFVRILVNTNCIDNGKKIWWDVRPHPFFETIEFRVCDIPMRMDETVTIAALVQAICVKLFKLREQNLGWRKYRRALILENKWRASRWGIDGKMIDFGKEIEVPFRDLAREMLSFVDDVVDELGSRQEVERHRRVEALGAGALAGEVIETEHFERDLGAFEREQSLENERVAVGGEGMYEARCRRCHTVPTEDQAQAPAASSDDCYFA